MPEADSGGADVTWQRPSPRLLQVRRIQAAVVASHGRVRRTTTWVPLEKAQSIRWVQGSVQRRLGLASVLVDVPGRRVTASIWDRAAAEADEILWRLPAQARAARARVAG
jgi:putative membrane protein